MFHIQKFVDYNQKTLKKTPQLLSHAYYDCDVGGPFCHGPSLDGGDVEFT